MNYGTRKDITFEHMYYLITQKYEKNEMFTPNHSLRKTDFWVMYKAHTKKHAVVQHHKYWRLYPSSSGLFHAGFEVVVKQSKRNINLTSVQNDFY